MDWSSHGRNESVCPYSPGGKFIRPYHGIRCCPVKRQASIAQASRTFRIFVSSTFSDLKDERNALQESVFPRLRQLAVSHGCRFQAVDLRWGVSEEAALDQQTMKICLGEVYHCQRTSPRPNFIILLGERYGWLPLPVEIASDEFDRVFLRVPPGDRPFLLEWYRRDDNAVPPVHVLQPRAGAYAEYDAWVPVEGRLHDLLEAAALAAGISDLELVKYTASATEQEIIQGAIQAAGSRRHVFCFSREMEGSLPACESAEAASRDARRLASLKKRLKEILGGNYHEYPASWEGNGPSLHHLDQLCEDVFHDLEGIILQEVASLDEISPLDREIHAHELFGEERARGFIGRVDILRQIDGYLLSSNDRPLVIWGASGSGKSALLAKAARQVEHAAPWMAAIQRFIGVTPESSNVRSLLQGLCRQIARLYAEDEGDLPSSYEELVVEFSRRLELATAQRPLVIFLDALDQLSDRDRARSLAWLPAELSPHVRIVVSALPGECRDVLLDRLPLDNLLELLPMPLEEGRLLLENWLGEAGRRLQPVQQLDILEKYERCGLPLYLRLAFEEVRRWRSYDGLPSGGDGSPGLGEGIDGVLRDLFWRLSQESSHGALLVSRSLGLLAAARNGLSEDELLDLLSADPEVLRDFRRRSPKSPQVPRLPAVIWSRLYFDLEPYLVEKAADGTALLAFYHPGSIGRMAAGLFLEGGAGLERHRSLAAYFGSQPLQRVEGGQRRINLRKTSEQVFQQRRARLWDLLYSTLTDFDFLEARCQAASAHDLEADFVLALDGWMGRDRPVLEALVERLRLESHHIQAYPELLFPQLYNHLTWLDRTENGPVHRACEQAARGRRDYLRLVRDPRPAAPLYVGSIEGPGDVRRLAVSADGRLAVSSAQSLLKVWDLQTGRLVHVLRGHAETVNSLAISGDGRTLISAAENIKIWDLQRGDLLRSIEGHSGTVQSLIFSPDEKTILSGAADGVKIWMAGSGTLVRSIPEDHPWPLLYAIALTPDGRTLLLGVQNRLTLRDVASGRLLRVLEGHQGTINSITLSPDARTVVTGSEDKTIKLWDLESGSLVRTLQADTGPVTAVQVSPSGRVLLGSVKDGTLKFWDMSSGELLSSFQAHLVKGHASENITALFVSNGGKVLSGGSDCALRLWDISKGRLSLTISSPDSGRIAVTPDGLAVIAGSRDGSLNLWDVETGQVIRTYEGETGSISSVVISRDQRMVLSGSGQVSHSTIDRDGWHTIYTPYNAIKAWDYASGQLLFSLSGHAGYVHAIALSGDGKILVSGSIDKTMGLWDLEQQKLLHSFQGQDQPVTAVAVSPDSCLALSGGEDGTVMLWDLPARRRIRTLAGHRGAVTSVGFVPGGGTAVSASMDGSLRIWDLATGGCLFTLEGHTQAVHSIACSPDGETVLSGSADGSLKLWGVASGELLHSFEGNTGQSIQTVSLSADGRTAVSASRTGVLLRWDLAGRRRLNAMEGHSGRVAGVAVSGESRTVASTSKDRTLRLWDLQTGDLLRTLENKTGETHGEYDEYHAVAMLGDGERLLSASKWLKLWDLPGGRLLSALSSGESTSYICAAVATDNRTALCGSMGSLELWDLETGAHQELADVDTGEEGVTHVITSVWISPDGREALSGANRDATALWDLEKREIICSFELDEGEDPETSQVALLPDGRTALCAEYSLIHYDALTGSFVQAFDPADQVTRFAVLPGAEQIITVSRRRRQGEASATLKLRDLRTGAVRALFSIDCAVSSLSVSRDGQWIACGDALGRVWIFQWIRHA